MRGRHRAGRKAPAAKSLIIAPSLPRSAVSFFFFFFSFFLPSRSRAGIHHYPPRNSPYRYARNEFRCVLGAQQVGELSRGASKKADFASSRVTRGPLSWSPGSVPFRSRRSDRRASLGRTERPYGPVPRGKVVRFPQLSDEAASYRCAYRVRAPTVVCM